MPINDLNSEWINTFPFLNAEETAVQKMQSQLQTINIPAQQNIFQPGMPCRNFLMILEGSVKVTLTSITGRQVVLYRVNKGETCILTTSCLLASESYSATGTTETDTRGLMLTETDFSTAMAESEVFKKFVFKSLGERFTNLINRIEQVNFGTIDARLAEALLTHSADSPSIHITHQSLANELGTAREVISRHLKQYESEQWVQLNRGSIKVIEPNALRALTQN